MAKNLVINSVQFVLDTRRWNDEEVGVFVRALVDSAIQDGKETNVCDSSFREAGDSEICFDKDMTVDGTSSFSYLVNREEWDRV